MAAQDPAFTYQGRLLRNDQPANGTFEMRFRLWNSDGIEGVGSPVSPELTQSVPVTNGLFTAQLDFGAAPFTGALIWLEIGVRTNGAGNFVSLAPRQRLTASPYAVRAALFDGPISDAQLPATIARLDEPWQSTNAVSLSNASNAFTGSFQGTGIFAALKVGDGPPARQLFHGTATVGSSTGGVKSVTIDLPPAMTGLPRVVATARSETASEMFAVTTRALSPTQVELQVLRLDIPGGAWAQALAVDWIAWE